MLVRSASRLRRPKSYHRTVTRLPQARKSLAHAQIRLHSALRVPSPKNLVLVVNDLVRHTHSPKEGADWPKTLFSVIYEAA